MAAIHLQPIPYAQIPASSYQIDSNFHGCAQLCLGYSHPIGVGIWRKFSEVIRWSISSKYHSGEVIDR